METFTIPISAWKKFIHALLPKKRVNAIFISFTTKITVCVPV